MYNVIDNIFLTDINLIGLTAYNYQGKLLGFTSVFLVLHTKEFCLRILTILCIFCISAEHYKSLGPSAVCCPL